MKYRDIMASKSNTDLVRIVTHLRHDYQPEAVVAAEAEMGSRNITVEQFDAAYEESEYLRQEEKSRAGAPLQNSLKILALLLPAVTFLILFMVLKAGGYDRRALDIARWNIFGLTLYAVAIFMFLLISRQL